MSLDIFTNKERLFFLLAQGALVLTPNNRLSDSILQEYFSHSNLQTIDKPKCLPYRAALIKAYEQLHFIHANEIYPTLLSDAQCQYLWRTIIQSESSIIYSEGLATAVRSAWERCQQWQINLTDPAFLHTAQTRQFQKWSLLFEEQLHQRSLITEYQIIPYLVQTPTPLFSCPSVWVCFDDFTPQQLHLQKHLIKQGFTPYQYELEAKSSKVEMLAASDDKVEYQQLMLWLQSKIKEGEQCIGVVVPNLEQESNRLQRTLAHHFDPTLFNISLGQPLSSFPLVAHALCWLNLDNSILTQHQANLLLQSAYLGSAKEEFMSRAQHLQDSRLLEKRLIPLTAFIEETHVSAPKLSKLLTLLTSYPPIATLHEWIELFLERLNKLGFPGDYGLTSENYQCLQRLITLFEELRPLAVLSSNLTQAEAFAALQHNADHTIFQPQKTKVPIQVCGFLEASGCEFDSLWVMGLTDQCLPQKVHLSAFIPPHIQRESHMPHSLPARELQFAYQILQRLKSSADSIVFSYAQLQGDNPNLPCSLITDLPRFILLSIDESKKAPPELVITEENFSLPVLPEESITGGTAILANQAKCPFKAFAEHRLRAKTSLSTSDGLNHKERGQIIHKVMELLWQKIGTQEQLLLLASDILDQYINEAIRTALTPLKEQYPDLFIASLEEVEYLRLKRLVLTYLEWEKQRAPFTIAELEQSYSISLAGLDFKVRIDRLDQVADKKWVIDYKSSLPASKPWNEERPKESQLLLYALLDDDINTLLLMQLKPGKINCAGFSEEKQGISGISALKKEETWSQRRNTWQQQLTNIAIEFQQGHCAPQPVDASICQQCDFQNLCRFQDAE